MLAPATIFDFPDHLALGRDLDDAFASAGSNERVAIGRRMAYARLDEVIPNDFSGAIIFGDYARYFGANEQGAFGCVAVTGVLRGAGLEGWWTSLPFRVVINQRKALDDHGVLWRVARGVDMHAFAGDAVLLGSRGRTLLTERGFGAWSKYRRRDAVGRK